MVYTIKKSNHRCIQTLSSFNFKILVNVTSLFFAMYDHIFIEENILRPSFVKIIKNAYAGNFIKKTLTTTDNVRLF